MRQVDPRLELASGDYDIAKAFARERGMPHTCTIAIMEKRFGIKRDALRNYRANYLSRQRECPREARHTAREKVMALRS